MPTGAREPWLTKRRRLVREEIERNRRGEATVPTWVLATLLAVVLVGWLLWIFLLG